MKRAVSLITAILLLSVFLCLPVFAVSYEAELESNTFGGSVIAGGKVGNIGDGNYLQFNNVNVSKTGTYEMKIHYYTNELREAYVSVNGGSGNKLEFIGKPDWWTIGVKTISVDLVAGSNTIKFYNDTKWCPDIDKIEISEIQSGKKFLIVASKPLYDTNNLQSTIGTYISDLRSEGWSPRLLTVDNVDSTNPEYVCPNSSALKSVISDFYKMGYEGFVLIGSHPNIQTAFWTYDQGISSHNIPSDVYYADMNNWGDLDSDGAYVPYPENPSSDVLVNFAPEMFFGRISAGSITDSIWQEATEVKQYLDKIHNYRVNGSKLTGESFKKSLIFKDGSDYKNSKAEVDALKNISPKINVLVDDTLTTPDNLEQELEKGYRFYFQVIHSQNDHHQMIRYNGTSRIYDDSYNYDKVTSSVRPKVDYMNLASCFACQFNKIDLSGSTPQVVKAKNIGAAYIFNNDEYVLNVTGQTGGWGLWLDADYYKKLANGTPIGQALKEYMVKIINNNNEVGFPKGILLGDPTLKYSTTVSNITPKVTTDLAGLSTEPRLRVKANNVFTINASDSDLGTNTIELNLSGNDALSTTMIQSATVSKQSGSISWTPKSSDVGKIYNLTVTAYNKSSNGSVIDNGYSETFTVEVISN